MGPDPLAVVAHVMRLFVSNEVRSCPFAMVHRSRTQRRKSDETHRTGLVSCEVPIQVRRARNNQPMPYIQSLLDTTSWQSVKLGLRLRCSPAPMFWGPTGSTRPVVRSCSVALASYIYSVGPDTERIQ